MYLFVWLLLFFFFCTHPHPAFPLQRSRGQWLFWVPSWTFFTSGRRDVKWWRRGWPTMYVVLRHCCVLLRGWRCMYTSGPYTPKKKKCAKRNLNVTLFFTHNFLFFKWIPFFFNSPSVTRICVQANWGSFVGAKVETTKWIRHGDGWIRGERQNRSFGFLNIVLERCCSCKIEVMTFICRVAHFIMDVCLLFIASLKMFITICFSCLECACCVRQVAEDTKCLRQL